MGGCMGGWGGGACQIAKNRINFELIEMPPTHQPIYPSVETSPPMDGCMGGKVGSCQIAKNRIDLNLIEIIQFCLKIYDL